MFPDTSENKPTHTCLNSSTKTVAVVLLLSVCGGKAHQELKMGGKVTFILVMNTARKERQLIALL